MTETIYTITNINGYTLTVFYSQAHCWQFRVISPVGSVYGSKAIYYSAQAAEAAGREWTGNKG